MIENPEDELRRLFPVSTPYVDDSGTDLLGLDYSQYKINEDRDYGTNWGDFFSSLGRSVAGAGKGVVDTILNPSGSGLLALIAALASSKERLPARGGGTRMAMPVVPRRAAMGGMMQAYAQGGQARGYAHGGPVRMEDGGFVLTERAVQGAGGPRGLAAVLPQARMIRGPGNGTSDSIPATISGPKGQTPARVSNGEAYVPRSAVQQAGGPKRMYGLMSALERRA
jgi:hypothetical protein